MNIFVLDSNPHCAVTHFNDTHVRSQLKETGQILSNGYTTAQLKDAPHTQMGEPRKHSYPHHPCCKWAIQNINNWLWTVNHGIALCFEFRYRFDKKHFTEDFILWCQKNSPKLSIEKLSPFAQAMPEQYRCEDAVKAYRNYYIHEKSHLAKWTKREVPNWFKIKLEV